MGYLKRISITKSRVRWLIAALLTLLVGATLLLWHFPSSKGIEYLYSGWSTKADSILADEAGENFLSPPITEECAITRTFAVDGTQRFVFSAGFSLFLQPAEEAAVYSSYSFVLSDGNRVLLEQPLDVAAFLAEGENAHYYTVPINKALTVGKVYTLSIVCTEEVENAPLLYATWHTESEQDDGSFIADMSITGSSRDYKQATYVLLAALACALVGLLVVFQTEQRTEVFAQIEVVSILCTIFTLYAVEFLNNSYGFFALPQLARFCNIAVFLAMVSVVYVLVGSVGISLACVGTLLTVGGIANYFSLCFRGAPILPANLFAIATAANVLGQYDVQLSPLLLFPIAILACVWCIAFSLWRKKLVRKWCGRLGFRLGALVLGGAMLYWINTPNGAQALQVPVDIWSPVTSNASNGFVVHFIENISAVFPVRPSGYTEKKANALASEYEAETFVPMQTPNILFIMNESLCDLEQSDVLQTSEPILPYIHSLAGASNALVGYVQVPVFGSGTSNSEFSALTGVTNIYFQSEAPYDNYVVRETPSLATVMKQLGYTTVAAHPMTGSNWNRNKAYPLLGFDLFWDIDSFENLPLVRYYSGDAGLYSQLEEKLALLDDPTFLFAVTMQNHGGYTYGTPSLPENISILQPAGDWPQATRYLNLARMSDDAFQELTAYYETVEEPTLIVMFGDHLPSVENDFLEAILSSENPLSMYTTPYVVWANYDLDKTQLPQDGETISVAFLQTVLMQAAGLPRTAWQMLLTDVREEYPVVSGFEVLNAAGESVENSLSVPLLRNYAYMQYNLFASSSHPHNFFLYNSLSP